MQLPDPLYFSHPEPRGACLPLVPFFLPFAGCPGRCVFCDQRAQTGQQGLDPNQSLTALASRLRVQERSFELGFFGGTFTGQDCLWQDRFLDLATEFRGPDRLCRLRVSTRPDMVDPHTLTRLRDKGVNMVELGVQTFATDVLRQSGRGYSGDIARQACALVRDAGLELGIQLLPGLPGHDPDLWQEDVRQTLLLKPAVVRIYPCVVMAGTGLCSMYERGCYAPWPLELAVAEAGRAVLDFWLAGIRVIRLGLAPERDMLDRLVAGPWHPAFGNMVRSKALLLFLEAQLGHRVAGIRALRVPVRHSGELWGHGRANAPGLAALGIGKECVRFWNESDFCVEWESI